MKNRYEEEFNKKIDYFKFHKRYQWLRKTADDALSLHTGFGANAIVAQDFMDRIVAMPLSYIHGFLDDKNHLEWTPVFENRLKAFNGGYLDVFDKYPDYSFQITTEKGIRIFTEFEYEVFKKIGPDTFVVGKKFKEKEN